MTQDREVVDRAELLICLGEFRHLLPEIFGQGRQVMDLGPERLKVGNIAGAEKMRACKKRNDYRRSRPKLPDTPDAFHQRIHHLELERRRSNEPGWNNQLQAPAPRSAVASWELLS